MGHLKHNKAIVVEELLAPNHRQIREDVTERSEAIDTVEEQELGDLTQVREGEVLIVRGFSIVYEQDAEVALYHGAVNEAVEGLYMVADVQALAHCNNKHTTLKSHGWSVVQIGSSVLNVHDIEQHI